MNRNVTALTLSQMLAMSVSPALMFIGTIIGQDLAPRPEWATLPIAALVVGTALGAYPLVTTMQKKGRRPVFLGCIVVASLACALISLSLQLQSFALYCFAIGVIGVCLSGVQQFRFAAMESVEPGKMPRAASTVMLAGVAAAFIGPELALVGRNLFTVEFTGSFLLLALCYVACFAVMWVYEQPQELRQTHRRDGGSAKELFGVPLFWVAVFGGTIGFVIMTFVMTATPISMHDHHGHSLVDTKWVIQSHVTAMFLPSLILPWLVARLGAQSVIVLGLICYGVTIAIGITGPGIWYFWFSLVFLGIGWNFMFLGATTLLPQTHRPEHHFKAQAVNDSVVFSLQAVAALGSGAVLNLWGWHSVLLACLPLMAVQLVLQFFCNRKHLALNPA